MFSTSMVATFNPCATRGGIASLPSFYFVMEVLHGGGFFLLFFFLVVVVFCYFFNFFLPIVLPTAAKE